MPEFRSSRSRQPLRVRGSSLHENNDKSRGSSMVQMRWESDNYTKRYQRKGASWIRTSFPLYMGLLLGLLWASTALVCLTFGSSHGNMAMTIAGDNTALPMDDYTRHNKGHFNFVPSAIGHPPDLRIEVDSRGRRHPPSTG